MRDNFFVTCCARDDFFFEIAFVRTRKQYTQTHTRTQRFRDDEMIHI